MTAMQKLQRHAVVPHGAQACALPARANGKLKLPIHSSIIAPVKNISFRELLDNIIENICYLSLQVFPNSTSSSSFIK